MDTRAAAGEDVGPLCGLLFAVKDTIDVSGYPTVGGTPGLEGNFPELNSPLIDRLQAANGIVLGKVLKPSRMKRMAPVCLLCHSFVFLCKRTVQFVCVRCITGKHMNGRIGLDAPPPPVRCC